MQLKLLEKRIGLGSFHLHLPGGRVYSVGQGEPAAHMIVHRPAALRGMLRNPEIALGESYMNGDWDPGEGGLLRVFEVIARNQKLATQGGMGAWFRRALSWLGEIHPLRRSQHNVERHYDIDEALFRRFLDPDLQYSCAYFEHPDMTLEQAQQAKCRHIARKLQLNPGDRVLDIGSGWGGMALHLARNHEVQVTGLTLSQDQYRSASRRAAESRLDHSVHFALQDYRQHLERNAGAYDAIVSVGMFEHVGRPQYPVFFDTVRRLLKPGGRMLLHTIGRSGPPTHGNHWIPLTRQYLYTTGLAEPARQRFPRSRAG